MEDPLISDAVAILEDDVMSEAVAVLAGSVGDSLDLDIQEALDILPCYTHRGVALAARMRRGKAALAKVKTTKRIQDHMGYVDDRLALRSRDMCNTAVKWKLWKPKCPLQLLANTCLRLCFADLRPKVNSASKQAVRKRMKRLVQKAKRCDKKRQVAPPKSAPTSSSVNSIATILGTHVSQVQHVRQSVSEVIARGQESTLQQLAPADHGIFEVSLDESEIVTSHTLKIKIAHGQKKFTKVRHSVKSLLMMHFTCFWLAALSGVGSVFEYVVPPAVLAGTTAAHILVGLGAARSRCWMWRAPSQYIVSSLRRPIRPKRAINCFDW